MCKNTKCIKQNHPSHKKNINKHLLFKILIVSLQSSNIYHTFSSDNKIVSSSSSLVFMFFHLTNKKCHEEDYLSTKQFLINTNRVYKL